MVIGPGICDLFETTHTQRASSVDLLAEVLYDSGPLRKDRRAQDLQTCELNISASGRGAELGA